MATATSFRNCSNMRPSRYRTPSPPRQAVEPISPRASTDLHPFWSTHYDGDATKRRVYDQEHIPLINGFDGFQDRSGYHQRITTEANVHNKIGGHSRSGSTIDTLATIALATSPTFAPLPYGNAIGHADSAGSKVATDQESGERPSKRARSEKAPSPAWQTMGSRPATSHISNLDSMKTDAELLLNFARPSNFPPLSNSVRPRPSVNMPVSGLSGESKWNANPCFHRGGHWDVSADNESPSAFFNIGSGSPSRTRSRSDGSAAVARLAMNGLRPGSSHFPSLMEPALDEEPGGLGRQNEISDSVAGDMIEQDRHQKGVTKSKRPRSPLASGLKNEDLEIDSSSQAKCAACNLIRVTVDGEDQTEVTWVNCDGCRRWFHIVCAGFKNDREIRTVDKFICRECRPIHGPTTFVRKSSRARTAIDYAGLNQGFIKPSAEAPEHHYIQPIKEGKFSFRPDNFARMRPELITAEYFERGVGMTEPIVIPSCWNPHTPAAFLGLTDDDMPFEGVTTQEEFDHIIDSLRDDDDGYEEAVDCGQDLLDMVIPDGLTVRTVAELYGPDEKVEVIDVKSQQGEDKKWNMRKWADYYYENAVMKAVRNVISLEVSQSPLGRLIRRPRIVRDLDLQDSVWPAELKAIGDYPKVQFYCLMSVANCYTDFHIDFGGSSVFYHILRGKKTFFFIPPKDKHLKKYEEWCNSAAQDTTFLGNQTKECYRVDLSEGDTMLIPSGWIHAVWTPEDSLVIGGNFLTRMNYGMQIRVAKIEKDTKVPRKFRYPFFQKILWYTAIRYLEDDPIPDKILDAFSRDENYRFYRQYPVYYEFGDHVNISPPGSDYYNSRFYSQAELDGLPELAKYLLRTALVAGGYTVEGVTTEARNAIKRSIPKGQGDPVETVRKFGVWIAWKRGNEPAARWTRLGAISLDVKVDMSDKKTSGRPSRRSERNIAESLRHNAERHTPRRPSDQSSELASGLGSTSSPGLSNSSTPAPRKSKSSATHLDDDTPKARTGSKNTGLGPKRVACDACRKRRIRCRHKDELNGDNFPGRPSLTKQKTNMEMQGHSRTAAAASSFSITNTTNTTDQRVRSGVVSDRTEASGAGDFSGGSILVNTPQGASGKAKGISLNSPVSGKKARSKACDECRKSKRRCIHDENGRVDPIKAQERSKPRAAVSAKRPRSSEENISLTPSKRQTQDPDIEFPHSDGPSPGRPQNAVQHLSDQGQKEPTHSAEKGNLEEHAQILGENLEESQNLPVSLPVSPADITSYASPPALKADRVAASDVAPLPVNAAPTGSLVSPPTSLADDMDVESGRVEREMRPTIEGEHEGEHEGEQSTPIDTPGSTSRHSSHQPRALAETPMSTAKSRRVVQHQPSNHHPLGGGGTELTNIAEMVSPSSSAKKSSSRPTSSHCAHPDSSTLSTGEKKSPTSVDKAIEEGRHSNLSPTSPQRPVKVVKRERVSFVENEADQESLRLIRELQEQEFGLRRRGTRA